jgi:peptidyl-prolyl cis-trans isomerase A (cyclophilin A)
MYAFGLFAAVAMVQAEDANKTEKPAIASPDFTDPAKLAGKAPETFKAQFDTTKGKFTIDVTRSLSPNGADRFYNLVRSGYFKDLAFFRVIPGFMCQFGIHGDPDVSAKWRAAAQSTSPPPAPTRAPPSCSSILPTTLISTAWGSRHSAK